MTVTDAGDVTDIEAQPITVDTAFPPCVTGGKLPDHVTSTLVDLPTFGYPANLRVRIPKLHCPDDGCDRRIHQAPLDCADVGEKVTARVTRWILQRPTIDRMCVSATATALDIG